MLIAVKLLDNLRLTLHLFFQNFRPTVRLKLRPLNFWGQAISTNHNNHNKYLYSALSYVTQSAVTQIK